MGYWRPNAASLPAIKRYVIDFDDNTIPVMTYLRSSDYGEFDPYMAFLRTSNDQHIGHADFIEVYASIGFFGKRIRRRYFGFEFGPIEWARESVTVNRTVFVTELRLPSGRVHEAHRISQQFGHTRLNVAGKTISEQNDQLRRWSQPFVTAALDVRDFRE